MNEGVGLFHKSVKIAVLNPSALNEQYLKAHNGKGEGYLPYIRKLMALYRARDFLGARYELCHYTTINSK